VLSAFPKVVTAPVVMMWYPDIAVDALSGDNSGGGGEDVGDDQSD